MRQDCLFTCQSVQNVQKCCLAPWNVFETSPCLLEGLLAHGTPPTGTDHGSESIKIGQVKKYNVMLIYLLLRDDV